MLAKFFVVPSLRDYCVVSLLYSDNTLPFPCGLRRHGSSISLNRDKNAPNASFLPVFLVFLPDPINEFLLIELALLLKLFRRQMTEGDLSILANEGGMIGVVGAVEVVAITGFAPDGFPVLSRQSKGLAAGSFHARKHRKASDDERFL